MTEARCANIDRLVGGGTLYVIGRLRLLDVCFLSSTLATSIAFVSFIVHHGIVEAQETKEKRQQGRRVFAAGVTRSLSCRPSHSTFPHLHGSMLKTIGDHIQVKAVQLRKKRALQASSGFLELLQCLIQPVETHGRVATHETGGRSGCAVLICSNDLGLGLDQTPHDRKRVRHDTFL